MRGTRRLLHGLRRKLLLNAFHLLYHQFAWAYEAVSRVVSLGRWRAWGEASLPFLAGQRILELGHGPGHLLMALNEGGWWAVGLDASPQMGQMARRRLRQKGQPARLARGRGQLLPFREGSFDAVVATFPSPYIMAVETLANVKRVMQPGGRLVIVPEAQLSGAAPLARVVEWVFKITGQRNPGVGNRDEGSDAFWRRKLAEQGFLVAIHRIPISDSLATIVVAELVNNDR